MSIKKYRPYLTVSQIQRALKLASDAGDSDLIKAFGITLAKAEIGILQPASVTLKVEEKLGFTDLHPEEESNLFDQIVNASTKTQSESS